MGSAKDVPAWISELPIIQQEIAKKKDLEINRRRDAAAKIAEWKATADAVIPGLQEKVDQARATIAAHDAERKTLQGRLAAAAAALAAKKLRVEAEIRQAEIVLLESYDPIIDETISYFRDTHEKLRSKTVDTNTCRGKTNLISETKEMTTFSNYASIVAALRYCTAAVDGLESMKLTTEVNLEKIAALKKGMPDVGEMTKITGEKPLPRVVVDQRDLLPSDDQIKWKIGKLNEKFQKLMGGKNTR